MKLREIKVITALEKVCWVLVWNVTFTKLVKHKYFDMNIKALYFVL